MKRFSLVLAALLASACSNSAGVGPDVPDGPSVAGGAVSRAKLDANRRKFDTTVGDDYTIEFQLGCFCTEEARAKVRLTVRGGAITSVVRVSDGAAVPQDTWPYTYKTVGQVFDELEHALENDFPTVNASYDATYGFPREVYIDEDEGLADEERSYGLSNVVPLP
jgi:predicted small secreted protein